MMGRSGQAAGSKTPLPPLTQRAVQTRISQPAGRAQRPHWAKTVKPRGKAQTPRGHTVLRPGPPRPSCLSALALRLLRLCCELRLLSRCLEEEHRTVRHLRPRHLLLTRGQEKHEVPGLPAAKFPGRSRHHPSCSAGPAASFQPAAHRPAQPGRLEDPGIFLNNGVLTPAHASSLWLTPAYTSTPWLTLAHTGSHQLTPAHTGSL